MKQAIKYYKLYIQEDRSIIKLNLMKNNDCLINDAVNKCIDDNIHKFNNYYSFSTNRKLLKQKALNLKNHWIKETEKELEILRGIKL